MNRSSHSAGAPAVSPASVLPLPTGHAAAGCKLLHAEANELPPDQAEELAGWRELIPGSTSLADAHDRLDLMRDAALDTWELADQLLKFEADEMKAAVVKAIALRIINLSDTAVAAGEPGMPTLHARAVGYRWALDEQEAQQVATESRERRGSK